MSDSLKLYSKPYSLAEIYQSVKISFSFITKELKQVNPYFVCRDFAHDCVRTNHTGKSSSIYGFSYDLKEDSPIDPDNTRMLIKNIEPQEVADGVHLLNHYEEMAGVEKTVVKDYFQDDEKHYMFISDKFWQQSSFHISLYTMLIRLGNKHLKFKDDKGLQDAYDKAFEKWSGDNDLKYMREVRKIINKFVTHSFDKNYFLEYSDLAIHSFHNHGGIFSLATGVTYDANLNKEFKVV